MPTGQPVQSPTESPSETPGSTGGLDVAALGTAARDGALFDWAQQVPEWRGAAAARVPAPRRPQAQPLQPARPVRPADPAQPAQPGRPADPVPQQRPRAAARPYTAAPPLSPAARELWYVRLTRRGRVVAVSAASVLATAALAGLFIAVATAGASASGAAAESALSGSGPATVVVRDGDTLWSIAERVRPGHDPRSTVHEIVRENELRRSELEPGQELVMPDF
ncbi:hypothetical protein GCM10027570_35770 [Streptomonospora sediminis]